jgi:predicted DNA-binding protein
MSTSKPRLIVTLESPLYDRVKQFAKQHHLSLSEAARDLIKEAFEDVEDWGLVNLAKDRISTLDKNKLIKHQDFWK